MAIPSFGAAPNQIANSLSVYTAGLDKPRMQAIEWLTLLPILLELVPTLLQSCKKPASSVLRGIKSEDGTDRVLVGRVILDALTKAKPMHDMESVSPLHIPSARAGLLAWLDACDDGQLDLISAQLVPWQASWE